mmetsp:Transcript_4543/g.12738  ORF Transcript_4543/g.12738 Transcript_4543/m.12738 type:complete len:291 (-) Transcript_4543:287-1159(-)
MLRHAVPEHLLSNPVRVVVHGVVFVKPELCDVVAGSRAVTALAQLVELSGKALAAKHRVEQAHAERPMVRQAYEPKLPHTYLDNPFRFHPVDGLERFPHTSSVRDTWDAQDHQRGHRRKASREVLEPIGSVLRFIHFETPVPVADYALPWLAKHADDLAQVEVADVRDRGPGPAWRSHGWWRPKFVMIMVESTEGLVVDLAGGLAAHRVPLASGGRPQVIPLNNFPIIHARHRLHLAERQVFANVLGGIVFRHERAAGVVSQHCLERAATLGDMQPNRRPYQVRVACRRL